MESYESRVIRTWRRQEDFSRECRRVNNAEIIVAVRNFVVRRLLDRRRRRLSVMEKFM